jgi:hypothetical protein
MIENYIVDSLLANNGAYLRDIVDGFFGSVVTASGLSRWARAWLPDQVLPFIDAVAMTPKKDVAVTVSPSLVISPKS